MKKSLMENRGLHYYVSTFVTFCSFLLNKENTNMSDYYENIICVSYLWYYSSWCINAYLTRVNFAYATQKQTVDNCIFNSSQNKIYLISVFFRFNFHRYLYWHTQTCINVMKFARCTLVMSVYASISYWELYLFI